MFLSRKCMFILRQLIYNVTSFIRILSLDDVTKSKWFLYIFNDAFKWFITHESKYKILNIYIAVNISFPYNVFFYNRNAEFI